MELTHRTPGSPVEVGVVREDAGHAGHLIWLEDVPTSEPANIEPLALGLLQAVKPHLGSLPAPRLVVQLLELVLGAWISRVRSQWYCVMISLPFLYLAKEDHMVSRSLSAGPDPSQHNKAVRWWPDQETGTD